MRSPTQSSVSLFLLIVLFVAACSAPSAPTQPPPTAAMANTPVAQPQPTATMANTPPSSYDDPFACCAAVGAIDTPDARYTGPKLPAEVAYNAIDQGFVSPDMPPEIQMAMVWRCMNGQVWVCHVGGNLPCGEKADVSKTPSAAIEDFCKANPAANIIPAVVTGRATVYERGCSAGKAEIVRQVFQADPQGYPADFWHQLAQPPPLRARSRFVSMSGR